MKFEVKSRIKNAIIVSIALFVLFSGIVGFLCILDVTERDNFVRLLPSTLLLSVLITCFFSFMPSALAFLAELAVDTFGFLLCIPAMFAMGGSIPITFILAGEIGVLAFLIVLPGLAVIIALGLLFHFVIKKSKPQVDTENISAVIATVCLSLCGVFIFAVLNLNTSGYFDQFTNSAQASQSVSAHHNSEFGSYDTFDDYEDDDEGREEYNEIDYYVLNTSTKKIHLASCSWADKISLENRRHTSDNYTLADAFDDGYTYCGHCLN